MKLYESVLKKIVRIQIAKKGEEVQYISLEECTMQEVEDMCKMLIAKKNLSVFEKGLVTSINMREFLGATAKKAKSISFRGLSTKETYDIIINHLTKK